MMQTGREAKRVLRYLTQTVIESTSYYRTLALLLLLISALHLQACALKSDRENEPTPVLSGPPDTTFPQPPINGITSLEKLGWVLIDGRRVTVSSFRGQVLVLDLYATWCAPCRESIPHLVALNERYGSQGLAIVGLNVGGPEDRQAVPAFARELRIHYPLGFPDRALANLLMSDSDSIPQTFIFDRQGHLVKRYVGFDTSMEAEFDRTIRLALAAQ